jgi:hypothetical protein|tara:strand:+ start:300 stop:704 length:405 start_codon:yes stop_codon:yes gene_type:complete
MENAALLEKHAQMQGVDPDEMRFRDEDQMPTNMEEEIVTAEDYLDDYEEEAAERIIKERDVQNKPKHAGQGVQSSEDMNESSIEQILEDEEGNLYIEDADGNLIPYELPGHLQNMRMPKSPESQVPEPGVRRNS